METSFHVAEIIGKGLRPGNSSFSAERCEIGVDGEKYRMIVVKDENEGGCQEVYEVMDVMLKDIINQHESDMENVIIIYKGIGPAWDGWNVPTNTYLCLNQPSLEDAIVRMVELKKLGRI